MHGKEKIYIPAHLVKNIADSTGAGDQFAAGFLYGFARNFSLERSGQLGSTAAATIIQQIGAKPDKAFTEILSRYYE